jgi:hypothetical protein
MFLTRPYICQIQYYESNIAMKITQQNAQHSPPYTPIMSPCISIISVPYHLEFYSENDARSTRFTPKNVWVAVDKPQGIILSHTFAADGNNDGIIVSVFQREYQ